MKRFFCTKCERTRRVRVFPPGVTDENRVGLCGWHGKASHKEYIRTASAAGTRHETHRSKPSKCARASA